MNAQILGQLGMEGQGDVAALAQGHGLAAELGEHFHALAEIDTSDVPMTSHAIPMLNVYREDAVGASLPVEDIVANAPDGVDEFFRVPRIVDE